MSPRDQIRKGSTDFVVLSLLVKRPMYGYEISQQLGQRSGGYFEMKEGLLYPALHHMQEKGWLTTEWRKVEGRRRKYYALTKMGLEVLDQQAAEWKTFLEKLDGLLQANDVWTG
ncbi:MAG: PadR family transcriptional regulator [Chloroflexi bacterium]|nr:PadR family transcriptional regulator [Chloroflexota bacterium]